MHLIYSGHPSSPRSVNCQSTAAFSILLGWLKSLLGWIRLAEKLARMVRSSLREAQVAEPPTRDQAQP
jgi:hypothetical protein